MNFKQFSIQQNNTVFKVGTDGILLGAWAASQCNENQIFIQTVLDIGTATGLIALMLAQKLTPTNPNIQITAIDINPNAIELAKQNVHNSKWSDKITILKQSLQTLGNETQFDSRFASQPNLQFDLIVSNPPYFKNSLKNVQTTQTQARHTLTLSHIDLVQNVYQLLKETGRFCLILPTVEAEQFIQLAENLTNKKEENTQLYCTHLVKVRPKIDKPIERYLLQFEKIPKTLQTNELTIQFERNNHYTPEYVALTKDFYTIL